jgi:hypothetical protein
MQIFCFSCEATGFDCERISAFRLGRRHLRGIKRRMSIFGRLASVPEAVVAIACEGRDSPAAIQLLDRHVFAQPLPRKRQVQAEGGAAVRRFT